MRTVLLLAYLRRTESAQPTIKLAILISTSYNYIKLLSSLLQSPTGGPSYQHGASSLHGLDNVSLYLLYIVAKTLIETIPGGHIIITTQRPLRAYCSCTARALAAGLLDSFDRVELLAIVQAGYCRNSLLRFVAFKGLRWLANREAEQEVWEDKIRGSRTGFSSMDES